MESPTVKGLENCNDTPLSIFPKISLAAKAVATPVFGTKKISYNQHHKSKQTNINENTQSQMILLCQVHWKTLTINRLTIFQSAPYARMAQTLFRPVNNFIHITIQIHPILGNQKVPPIPPTVKIDCTATPHAPAKAIPPSTNKPMDDNRSMVR